jgi:hypothetical protein
MGGERNKQATRGGAGRFALLVVALALGGCGSTDILKSSPLDVFSSSSKATNDTAPADPTKISTDDIECPDVQVRTGAATLMIGTKPGESEPAAMDVRYQGSIIRTARECHVNAGIMTMKVGIEGRVITGPAGGPGAVDVPLRIAVVREGITPQTIVSKLGRESVVVNEAIDRVTFAHVESDITFPLPTPPGDIDRYVVYVGFDPLGARPEKKKPPARKPAVKPKSVANLGRLHAHFGRHMQEQIGRRFAFMNVGRRKQIGLEKPDQVGALQANANAVERG